MMMRMMMMINYCYYCYSMVPPKAKSKEGYEKKGCSLVELMAIEVQRPHWFVSHAWIEPWLIGKLSRARGRRCYCVSCQLETQLLYMLGAFGGMTIH
jgi:hypothetical protein